MNQNYKHFTNKPIDVLWCSDQSFIVGDINDALILRLQRGNPACSIGVDSRGLGPSYPIVLMIEEVQYGLERNWIKLCTGKTHIDVPASLINTPSKPSNITSTNKILGMYYPIQIYIDIKRCKVKQHNLYNDRPLKRQRCESNMNSMQDAIALGWKFPSCHREYIKYKVYVDMRDRGYIVTAGAKFGGDYLAYTSDPMEVHSQMIITVLDHYTNPVPTLDMISVARISSTTKKECIFACIDEKNEIKYITFNWIGSL